MASVTLNEPALTHFLRSTGGPVGIDLARRAFEVQQQAEANASGLVLKQRSGKLFRGISTRLQEGVTELEAVVSTNAFSSWHDEPFAYPRYLETLGFHWLTGALAERFRG